jgi:hypothetical protein
MLTESIPPLTPARAVLYGTLVVGTLDITEVIVYVGLKGVAPLVVLQSVASGLLGPGSYRGGVPTALLGLALHFTIALAVVAAYQLASHTFRGLARAPLAWGALYGLAVYAVMNLAVVPLSQAALGQRTLAGTVNGLLIHVLGVGIPSALFVSAAHRWQAARRPLPRGRAAAPMLP